MGGKLHTTNIYYMFYPTLLYSTIIISALLRCIDRVGVSAMRAKKFRSHFYAFLVVWWLARPTTYRKHPWRKNLEIHSLEKGRHCILEAGSVRFHWELGMKSCLGLHVLRK